MVGEAFGQLASGSATDPNTGPLLVLGALALVGVTGRWQAAGGVSPAADVGPGRSGVAPVGGFAR